MLRTEPFSAVCADDCRARAAETEAMKGHWMHMAICGVLVVAATALVATGTSAAVLIPVAACVVMMGGMMLAMGMFASRHRGG